MQFFFSSLTAGAVIDVPDGADLSLWTNRVSPGQTLRLAKDGSYTLAGGSAGFSGLPNGTASSVVTVDGNGATITGGSVGVDLANKAYLTFTNLHLREQTACCVQMQNSHHIEVVGCSFKSTVNPAFIDVTKIRNCQNVWFRHCDILASSGVPTCDGFEFWDCTDSGCEDCTADGLHSGDPELDNGHGFEVYGENAGQTCTNIQFIRCHASNCRVGFSVESPFGDAPHTAFLTDCTTADNELFAYNCEAPAEMTIDGYDGGTTTGSGTIITD